MTKAEWCRKQVLWSLWLLLLLCTACGSPQLFHQEAYVFGTRIELKVYGGSREQAEAGMGAVLREFDRLHRAYHAWQPSELTTLNQALAQSKSVKVSAELARLLQDAQAISAQGEGLFDPGLGALVKLWGFHADEFKPVLPDATAVKALMATHPSIAQLQIVGQQVRSSNPAVQIDLGGYLKGYALDRADTILRQQGIHNALINIGGNVMALGRKGEQPWRLGILHPREPRPLAVLSLRNGEALGTSGDYQRFFKVGEQRYSHLLDPRSGYPATATQSLTILMSSSAHRQVGKRSDALSKPLFIAGDDWLRMARQYAIRHVLRVSSSGVIEVSESLYARLKLYPGKASVRVIDLPADENR